MKAMVCEMCNSNDIVKQGDYYVCQNCLTKYEPDAARKLIVEVDDSAKTRNLYKLARRAREEGNARNAAQYYSQILEQRPDDWEAYFYYASSSATNVKIANMAMAAESFSSAIVTSFKLLDDSDLSAEEKIEAAIEMGINVEQYGFMIAKNALSTMKEYLNIGAEIALQHQDEYHSNLNSGLMCITNCSDCIEAFFLNNTSYAETERYSFLKDLAVKGWKRVIELSRSASLPYRSDLVQKVLKYEPSCQAAVDQEEDRAAVSDGQMAAKHAADRNEKPDCSGSGSFRNRNRLRFVLKWLAIYVVAFLCAYAVAFFVTYLTPEQVDNAIITVIVAGIMVFVPYAAVVLMFGVGEDHPDCAGIREIARKPKQFVRPFLIMLACYLVLSVLFSVFHISVVSHDAADASRESTSEPAASQEAPDFDTNLTSEKDYYGVRFAVSPEWKENEASYYVKYTMSSGNYATLLTYTNAETASLDTYVRAKTASGDTDWYKEISCRDSDGSKITLYQNTKATGVGAMVYLLLGYSDDGRGFAAKLYGNPQMEANISFLRGWADTFEFDASKVEFDSIDARSSEKAGSQSASTSSGDSSQQPEASAPASSSSPTTSQVAAKKRAISYISTGIGFSYSRMVDQLEYDGFSHDDAAYGADNCLADWHVEAVVRAKNYRDSFDMSDSRLQEQLEYDGFNEEEIQYAMEMLG